MDPERAALILKIAALQQELNELRSEKDDLETVLEMTTEHSDAVEEELQVKAETALHESERRLRMIVEATPTPVLIIAADGCVVFTNDMVGPALGLDAEAVHGCEATGFFLGDEDKDLTRILAERKRVEREEFVLRRADGTLREIELSMCPLPFNDEPAMLCAFHDVTERKRQLEASRRFVPAEFLSFFQKDSIVELELGDFISEEMTVMFSDVRSFTAISEDMTPQQNFDFINAYLKRVSPVVRECGGFIVKYLGDGMMAAFPNTVDQAVQAGIEKLVRVHQYNKERTENGYLPIKVGIGIHSGHMMVGMVGEKNRMQGDAFSDDVNLASRIEGLTRYYDASLLISGESYARMDDYERYHIRFVDKVRVVGRLSAVHLYEIFDGDEPDIRDRKLRTRDIIESAQKLYYDKAFRAAQVELFKALQIYPEDKLAWHFLIEAGKHLEHGVDDDWSGVTVMTRK